MGGQFLRAVHFMGAGEGFPWTVPAVRGLCERGRLELHPAVTFFVGDNGSGKSTVLEAIADQEGLPAEGGSRNMADPSLPCETALGNMLKFERG
ncbi:MAG: AAA family ATPase, partial [Planctomycetota bacterium]